MSNTIITSLTSLLRRKRQQRLLRDRRIGFNRARAQDHSSRAAHASILPGPDGHRADATGPLTAPARSADGSSPLPITTPDRTMLLWLSRCLLFVSLLLPGSNMISSCSGACYAATNTLITLHFFRRCYESDKPSSGIVKCFSRQLRSVALIRFIHASRNAAPPGRLKRFHYGHQSDKTRRRNVRPPFRAAPESDSAIHVSPAEPSLFSPDALLRSPRAQSLPPCTTPRYNAAPALITPPQNPLAASPGCQP